MYILLQIKTPFHTPTPHQMQMDLRNVEELANDLKRGIVQNKDPFTSPSSNPNSDSDSHAAPPSPPVDPATALQLFLDHIPISSIPGIHNSPSSVLVVRTHICVKEGIRVLYEKNVSGALIADGLETDQNTMLTTSFAHPYVGFISFSNLVLWSLQEYRKHQGGTKRDHDKSSKTIKPQGFFSLLEKFPVVSEAKNSVNHILLQSSGLEWFDSIADKPLSNFRFEYKDRIVLIYNDQSIAEAVHILLANKVCAIEAVQRQTQKLIGCVRVSDIHHLLDDDRLFTDRDDTRVEQFIRIGTDLDNHGIDHELGALICAGNLALNNTFEPRMDSPVTNTERDTLKQVMKNLAEKKSNFCFLVDESERVRGMVTLRDVLMEFAPPCMDSRIDGGGFFDMALKESGCTIRDGTMVQL